MSDSGKTGWFSRFRRNRDSDVPDDGSAGEETPPEAGITGTARAIESVPEMSAPVTASADVSGKKGWMQRLREGLSRSSGALTSSISGIF
ncbi:MAG: hypothetical protein KDH19_12565, partial [Geminicoccaceae bacterium]|nr:hypothetical protein [Geminicoccaceae bacterium]